ncbi:unnamed protein product [Allacma fusca]|uniref:SAM domain-containing protein n=1 Tax=Allacma fusca TaxID=39272 RepID=A0A8J2NHC8_9HEXA|nr:unnamed protein product [Allacma fusca]
MNKRLEKLKSKEEKVSKLGLSLSQQSISDENNQQHLRDHLNLLVLLKSVMTELDSSSPVIWPSWCYGSENGQDDEKPALTSNNSSGLNLNEKPNKRRRKEAERSSPSESVQSDSEIGIKRSPPPPHHRNYSDFMRSLAAKYNNLPIEPPVPQPATIFSRQQLENNRFLKQSLIDMSSTTALLHLVRSADLKKYHQTPLDLTNNNNNNSINNNSTSNSKKDSNCCSSQEVTAILNWSVDDVCRFVSTIDLCKEYAESFRSQSIDGSGLPLLTEEHLIGMGMKLGPALKFKSVLRRRLGNCIICQHCPHCHHTLVSEDISEEMRTKLVCYDDYQMNYQISQFHIAL